MNQTEKVAKWLIEKHSFEPEDATEVAKDFLTLIGQQVEPVDIVFDGPPAPESGRFIEVEDHTGKSIKFGEWVKRDDGYWVLRISPPASREREALERIEQELSDLLPHSEMGGTARYLLSVLHGETLTMRECARIPKDAILSEGGEG